MTSHTGRLYALALSLVVFALAWAAVAARPWAARAAGPRLQSLAAREAQLRQEAALVRKLAAQRQAAVHAQKVAASASSAAAAPSPSVRVVNLPPLTITRTS